jgi:hypothetical protein
MPDLKTATSVSIVVPFHNEEPNVTEPYGRLQGVMEELGRSYQFVAGHLLHCPHSKVTDV